MVAAFHGLATPRLLQKLRLQKKELFVWTVNTPEAIQRVLATGVDGIVTNQPALVQQAIQNLLRACSS